MYAGKLVFSQVMDHLRWHTFQRCVQRYAGNRKVKSFKCSDQYRCRAFAQLTYRESLQDFETCLRAQASKLFHLGITVASHANSPGNHRRISRKFVPICTLDLRCEFTNSSIPFGRVAKTEERNSAGPSA